MVGSQCHTSATLRPPPKKKKDLVPIIQEAEWVSRPGWMDTENFAPTAVPTLDRSVYRKSLYRLHYTGQHSVSYNNTLKVLTQLQFSVWNISFYEAMVLLIFRNNKEGYAFSINEACSTLKRLIIQNWIPDGIFNILLPNQQQTLCAVLILGDIILLRKDESLRETIPLININTHATLLSKILANLVCMQEVAKAQASTAM